VATTVGLDALDGVLDLIVRHHLAPGHLDREHLRPGALGDLVPDDMGPQPGMRPVGRHRQVAFEVLAALEVDHDPIADVIDADAALTGAHGSPIERTDEEILEVGAAHGIGVLADALDQRGQTELAQEVAPLVAVAHALHPAAGRGHLGTEPERVEHLDTVGPQRDPRAHRSQLARLVEHPHPMTGAREGDGRAESTDAGPHHDHLEVAHDSGLTQGSTPASTPGWTKGSTGTVDLCIHKSQYWRQPIRFVQCIRCKTVAIPESPCIHDHVHRRPAGL
jgi:hypothetical protein